MDSNFFYGMQKCTLRVPGVILAIVLLSFYSCHRQNGDELPNVIIILTDDQGSVDAGVYGSDDLLTPSIDKLASRGVMFSRFYVASAICSPSRAAILTGLSPHSAGVPGNVSSQPGSRGMPGEIVTIAELLKEAGYNTGHIGKWHLGYSEATMPLSQGFDYSFGHMGGCIDNYSHFFYWNGPNRHDLWENGSEIRMPGRYFPDLMAEKAADFIRKNRKSPFFLYYAINVPHYPLQPRMAWQNHYDDLEMPRRDYAAFVSTADENIGRLTGLLDKLRLTDNTIIIWLSDHGHSYEERTFGGGGNSGPFRGGKMSLFEGGIRVPAIISYPGTIPSGVNRSNTMYSCDIVPTILSLAGLDRKSTAFEGEDMAEYIINNKDVEPRKLFWKMGRQWAVMDGDWKLVGLPVDPSGIQLDPEKDRLFLSNLAIDSTERVNLAEKYPERVRDLAELYLGWKNSDPGDIPSETVRVENKAMGADVFLYSEPGKAYRAKGGATLVDGMTGSMQHSDGLWLGFEGSDMLATIDLGESKDIGSVSASFMNNPGAWIFLPSSVEISWSNDTTKFYRNQTIEVDTAVLRESGTKEYRFIVNDRARYLRLRAKNQGENPAWHNYPGGISWIFCDEIIILDDMD